jgi:peptidoglycan/LPS O-acetylase OafA/YrhL
LSPHERFLASRRFAALDGLRAISVLAVVWHHTAGMQYSGFMGRGALGVHMFFAISGFLITTLLLRERSRFGSISLRRFYARRTLRIFPIYYLVLLTYVVLVAVTRPGAPESRSFWQHLPSFATYTSNWFVELSTETNVTFYFAWSLATEEQFYLFWPPLLVLLLTWRGGPLWQPLTALALLSVATVLIHHQVDSQALGWRIAGSLALPILLGAAAGLLLHSRRGFDLLAPVLTRRSAAPVVAVVLIALIVGEATIELVELAMVILVAACCVREDTWMHPVLTLRPLVFVGTISYGVYLMHMLAANLARQVVPQEYGVIVFVPTVVLVLVAAHLSFRYFEGPILAYKRRYEVVS